jgi:sugar-specific transcriptional regulator TrmB
MKTEILEQIGLSKNEIKIYFALLELEQSSATPIVKKSGVPNSKVYPTLDKLIKRGLVSYVIKNNVKYFQASDPKNLIDFLNDKEKLISQQKREIEKLIPQIEHKRELAKDKQESTIYEGFNGVKVAFNNILNKVPPNNEYYVFTLGEELGKSELKHFFRDYHKKRIQKKIKVKLIANEKIRTIFKKYHIYKNMNVKFSKLKLPLGIFIYEDYVMTVVWGEEPTAFVIKSRNNAEKYKEFFLEIWKTATL